MSRPLLECRNVLISRDGWQGEYNFSLNSQEWLALLGPSGAGKSSLLNAILGLLPIQAGEIYIAGTLLNNLPPSQRESSMVFQHSILLSHLPIANSLLLALHDSRKFKQEKMHNILSYFSLLDLDPAFLTRYPEEISGGELARCNLCCALLREKKLLLLDEPFAALNEELRQQITCSLKKLQQQKGLTIIAATHQVDEALRTATRLLRLKAGRIVSIEPGVGG
jgi:ABC-type Fe3+/spermidine/putrescine transport system ATPase subunit